MTMIVKPDSEQLGVAVIGGGFMAGVHSRAARSARASLVGIASSTPARAREAALALGAGGSYDSVDDVFADPRVDVVHICTPNSTHHRFAKQALLAGKHVVCEKPLAANSADAAELVSLADEFGRVAVVPFVYRFHPMVREARARVRSGRAGAILTIQGAYLQDWLLSSDDDDWRVDADVGGPSRAFADIGSHLCDMIEFVTDDRIQRLAAVNRTVFGRRGTTPVTNEDIVCVVFQTLIGTIGTLTISQVAPGRKNRLTIELGASIESLSFDQETPETLWIGRREESLVLTREASTLDASASRYSLLPAGHPQGFQDAFDALVADAYQAVAGPAPDGLPVFADGHRSTLLSEAVLKSSRSGEWVDIDPEFSRNLIPADLHS